jgi:hypothetical protein
VIDNKDIGGDNLNQAYPEGTWKRSGGKKPYGTDSVYAMFGRKDATFTFEFVSPSTGKKKVYMWWTYYKNRSNAVPVTITYGKGKTKRKIVNQRKLKNGGKWNSIGKYKFFKNQIYSITITVPKKFKSKKKYKNKSACADAVKIVPIK